MHLILHGESPSDVDDFLLLLAAWEALCSLFAFAGRRGRTAAAVAATSAYLRCTESFHARRHHALRVADGFVENAWRASKVSLPVPVDLKVLV